MLHWFARRLNELQEKNRDERGFTLIELLVVVIIIGILAAIAIPVYLNQRERAMDAAASSDVRNMATAEESWLTANGAYTANVADLETEGFNKSDGVTGHNATPNSSNSSDSYCVEATSQSGQKFHLDSAATGQGNLGVQTGAC